ncbi:VOC family protein [Rhodobacterales bacterium HKCCE2091]|nr:VOC family protein [Rhodobacterales bacterium HKCCE2091]
METLRAMPVLDVSDLAASAEFYCRLGFSTNGIWGEPPGFAIVQRGAVTLALSLRDLSAPVPGNHGWAAYIYVTDVEALHAEFTAAGVGPTEIRRPTHYGCDDFDVTDPDGHRIAFGQDRHGAAGLGTDRGGG